jgi:hypothetical protein
MSTNAAADEGPDVATGQASGDGSDVTAGESSGEGPNVTAGESSGEGPDVTAGESSGEGPDVTAGEDSAGAAAAVEDSSPDDRALTSAAAMDFKARWETIQQGFVDDPRNAVTDADGLVSDLLKTLATTFEEQRRRLESQWSDGEPSTEELRGALRRYRDFFERLLTI